MLYVGRQDGKTLSYDLLEEDDLREFKAALVDDRWHSGVTGMSLAGGGNRTDLPLPRRFGKVRYDAYPVHNKDGKAVAEAVTASAGDVYVTLTRYLNGGSGRFRVDIDHRGQLRFHPKR